MEVSSTSGSSGVTATDTKQQQVQKNQEQRQAEQESVKLESTPPKPNDRVGNIVNTAV